MKKPLFNKIAIVGVGLIGGSLGLAIKKRGLANRVIGVVRTDTIAQQVQKKGAVDKTTFELKEGVKNADLVILSSRIFTIVERLKKIRPFLKAGALVIDVGSTKRMICETARKHLPQRQFVGCHPMAGLEKRGVAFSTPDLFRDSYCFIERHHRKIEQFWKAIGATPLVISPKDHDIWTAQASHRPHILAFASFDKKIDVQRYIFASSLKYLNPSFKGLARLAKSEPEIWADILCSNDKNVLSSIGEFEKTLKKYKVAISHKSVKRRSLALRKLLETAKENADFFLPE